MGEENVGFGEDGERVRTVGFAYPAEREDELLRQEDGRRIRNETLVRTFLYLQRGSPTAAHIGRKVILIGYLLNCSPYETRRDLARALGVSASRVCQLLSGLRRELEPLARLS